MPPESSARHLPLSATRIYGGDCVFLPRVQLRQYLQNNPAWNLILDPPLPASPISGIPGSLSLGSDLV